MAQVFGFEKDFQDYFRKEISKTVLEKVFTLFSVISSLYRVLCPKI
jgi:hypothetical protein